MTTILLVLALSVSVVVLVAGVAYCVVSYLIERHEARWHRGEGGKED